MLVETETFSVRPCYNFVLTEELYYAHIHLRLVQVFIDCKQSMIWGRNISIDFSRQVTEGCGSSWVQILGNQLINHSPYIRYTNRKYYLLYNTT